MPRRNKKAGSRHIPKTAGTRLNEPKPLLELLSQRSSRQQTAESSELPEWERKLLHA